MKMPADYYLKRKNEGKLKAEEREKKNNNEKLSP